MQYSSQTAIELIHCRLSYKKIMQASNETLEDCLKSGIIFIVPTTTINPDPSELLWTYDQYKLESSFQGNVWLLLQFFLEQILISS